MPSLKIGRDAARIAQHTTRGDDGGPILPDQEKLERVAILEGTVSAVRGTGNRKTWKAEDDDDSKGRRLWQK